MATDYGQDTGLSIPIELNPPHVNGDELRWEPTALLLEAALAIQIGKLAPVGYSYIANIIRNESWMTNPAHNVWLLAEAQRAGRVEEMQRNFPDAAESAHHIIEFMKKDDPKEMDEILKKVSQPGYVFKGIHTTSQTTSK
jgi:hypothetical protein